MRQPATTLASTDRLHDVLHEGLSVFVAHRSVATVLPAILRHQPFRDGPKPLLWLPQAWKDVTLVGGWGGGVRVALLRVPRVGQVVHGREAASLCVVRRAQRGATAAGTPCVGQRAARVVVGVGAPHLARRYPPRVVQVVEVGVVDKGVGGEGEVRRVVVQRRRAGDRERRRRCLVRAGRQLQHGLRRVALRALVHPLRVPHLLRLATLLAAEVQVAAGDAAQAARDGAQPEDEDKLPDVQPARLLRRRCGGHVAARGRRGGRRRAARRRRRPGRRRRGRRFLCRLGRCVCGRRLRGGARRRVGGRQVCCGEVRRRHVRCLLRQQTVEERADAVLLDDGCDGGEAGLVRARHGPGLHDGVAVGANVEKTRLVHHRERRLPHGCLHVQPPTPRTGQRRVDNLRLCGRPVPVQLQVRLVLDGQKVQSLVDHHRVPDLLCHRCSGVGGEGLRHTRIGDL
eukprot:Rhum_TRINITY_DN14432_c5_g1::Rhum_TRINITY_DN14432_c5_g1_i1::g.90931::m.90931